MTKYLFRFLKFVHLFWNCFLFKLIDSQIVGFNFSKDYSKDLDVNLLKKWEQLLY